MGKKELLTVDGFSGFEKRFIVNLSYVTISLSIFGLIINFFLGFSLLLVVFPVFIFLAFLGILLWAKHSEDLFYLKIVLTVLTFGIVNFFWYWNFGSHGPAPYFFVIIYSLLVFIWHGKGLWLVSLLMLINILAVFLIEYFNPDMIVDYSSSMARITDVYTGLAMYGILIFFLMNNSKTYLINEYIKAKESDRLKSAFLANLSHEIRTPMNAIIGFSQMLDDPDLSVRNRSFYVETINNQGEKLMSLINDIIDIARIESDSITLNEENVNLYQLIQNQIKAHKLKCKIGVEIEFREYSDMQNVLVRSDAVRLNQILNNLISNAVKFTQQGKVEISLLHPEKMKICILVKDTGMGIPKHEFDKIFNSFYQIELTDINKLQEGTGIGLALVKAIAEKMGGSVTLHSTIGVGSEFKVNLPLKIVGIEEVSGGDILSGEPDKSHNVLIIEETQIQFLYKKEIFEQLNCKVYESHNLRDAIELMMRSTTINILVFDLKVPGFQEYEKLERIKKLFPDIILIAQVGSLNDQDLKIQMPVIDYFVAKPFQIEPLKEILSRF